MLRPSALRISRCEGLHEGREQGSNEERRDALKAFDKFLAEEIDGSESDWTRRWAASVDGVTSYSMMRHFDGLQIDRSETEVPGLVNVRVEIST